jgi:hypothetical protein
LVYIHAGLNWSGLVWGVERFDILLFLLGSVKELLSPSRSFSCICLARHSSRILAFFFFGFGFGFVSVSPFVSLYSERSDAFW